MYGMVLMAALTTGGTTPDCHWRRGCGCCGYGGYGYGGGYGCWGGYGGWGGCMGCYGGCMGCYGGGMGMGMGGYGAWATGGGYGYSGGGIYGAPSGMTPAAPQGETVPVPPKPGTGGKTMLPTKAQLIVELPADAKLYIDDRPMKTTASKRTFNTPKLQPGQTYYYILRAEVVRDGQTVSKEQRILIHAGEVARAQFSGLEAKEVKNVAQASAR